jgi:Na+-translocating ferredoxin:NAD+ oxidoreductase RnfC subunit
MITAQAIQEKARLANVTLPGQTKLLVVNGVDTEPLLKNHAAILSEKATAAVLGLRLAMLASDASHGVFAVRSKEAARALSKELHGAPEIQLMRADDTYFADDPTLLRHILGAPQATIIEPATLLQLARLMRNEPSHTTTLTIAGAVNHPSVVEAPIGTPLSELARFAGAAPNTKLWSGGPMRGRPAGANEVAQLTTKALLALPNQHPLLSRGALNVDQELRRVASVCGGCRMCAEMCPPRLLGSPFDPQKALLALSTGKAELSHEIKGAMHCSGCGVCEKYVCPVGLRPASLLQATKAKLIEANIPAPEANPNKVHTAVELRQVPIDRLSQKLSLSSFATPSHSIKKFTPSAVRISLFGAIPTKKTGDRVQAGDLLTTNSHPVYASMSGTISEVSPEIVTIAL